MLHYTKEREVFIVIKAVIFDLDGTVTDTLSTIAYFGNLALNEHGLKSAPEEEYKYFAGDGKKVLIKKMLKYNNVDDDEIFKKVEKTYDAFYDVDPIGKTTPFEGIIPLIEKLREMGIKTAVNSNKPHDVLLMILDRLFPNGSFDKIYGQIDGIPHKPDPTLALRLTEELNVAPEECLFVGDTSVDMKTAKAAGMNAVGVLWGFRELEELKASGADYIVEKAEEILKLI